MKTNYLLFLLGVLTISCSSDDDNNNAGTNNPGNGTYIPTEQGNYWVYNVESEMMSGRDSIYVSGDTIINSQTYQKIRAQKQPTGFFSNTMVNNAVRHAGGKTYLSGTAGFAITGELPFDINLTDFVIFDENAAEGQTLSSTTGTLNQDMESFTLNFTYTLTSRSKAMVNSATINGDTYNNLKPVEIILNMGISVTAQIEGIPIPITYTIMQPQNVLVTTQYYAQGIGAVKSVTDISYQLSQIPGMELPIPQSGEQHQEELLDGYNLD